MRTCPGCARENTDSAETCEACGTGIPHRSALRRYLASALALLALIAIAVLAQSLFRSHYARHPRDFLPTSTLAAVGADLRPNSPAMRHLRRTWRQSDIDHLTRRATDTRLAYALEPGTRLQAWISPAGLSPALDRFGELKIKIWEDAAGGEGELSLKARPRDLLDGS